MNVEGNQPVPPRIALLERLSELLKRLFGKKKFDEEAAINAEHERLMAETRDKWNEQERERARKDAERAYNQRSSDEDAKLIEQAKTLQAAKVQHNLEQFLSDHGRAGSGYLYERIAADTSGVIKANLDAVIGESPAVAHLINQIVSREQELHGDAPALLNLTQSLLYEASKVPDGVAAVQPIVQEMERRAADIILETYPEVVKESRNAISLEDFVEGFLDTKLTNSEKTILNIKAKETDEAFRNKINSIAEHLDRDINSRNQSVKDNPQHEEWIDRSERESEAGTSQAPVKVVEAVDEIWEKVRRDADAGNLSLDDLNDIDKKILEAESSGFPKDVIPGTKAWLKAVDGAHNYVKDRRKELLEQYNKRLIKEKPPIRKVKSTKEFLQEMARRPGSLGYLLKDNPELEKLLTSYKEEGRQFRDQVFLTVHKKVLTDNYHSSRENFGLYESADIDTFLKIVRSGMADLVRPETGISFGQSWEEWYVNLSTTIQLSRDIDFWAAQPGASIEDMSKSLALFQNANSVQALTMPGVELAYRAFEDSLQSIRDSNDGYIPPALVGYDSAHYISYWDDRSKQMLIKWMNMGVVKDAKRDEFGFHKVESDGNTVQVGDALDYNKLHSEDPQDLQLSLYMTLGKGFGLASLRYLEMFANSKVPGSQLKGLGGKGFHSTPYEGPARSLNWFATMIHKWKMGTFKFTHMMNTLLPDPEKIPHITESTPKDIYIASRDKTLEKKFGKGVRRLFDLVNFSGASSAFGPPYTQWRHMDSTIGWSDKKRELLGGPTLIMFSRRFAGERVKDFFVTNKFKQEFREQLEALHQPTSGEQFDRLWKSKGEGMYEKEIREEWEEMNKHHKKEVEELTESYQKAFIARTWINMAMRNPLTVAHNMEVEVPDEIFPNEKKTIRLHSLIAQQVLGIPLEDTKYGEVAAKSADESSPTEKQRHYMEEVMDLEADIAAVREQAVISSNESVEQSGYYRELKESDFDIIKDPARRDHAKQYWYMVRKVMMGDLSEGRYRELYDQVGLGMAENGEDYAVNWEKIKAINQTLEALGKQKVTLDPEGKVESNVMLNPDWVNKDWTIFFGSDDTAFRRMNVLNLGPRQWARRGGDAVAHYQGGNKAGEYLRDLTPNPNPEDLAKLLRDLRIAYEGDAIEVGWQVAGLLAHGTSRLFAFDYSRMGSAAQLDVWGTRRGVAAWNANKRRAFFDTLEHMDVLPPLPSEEMIEKTLYDPQGAFKIPHDIHSLRKANRADNKDVWTEIITLGVLLAFALTIYRALTAPSEEEEGGGGGGHH